MNRVSETPDAENHANANNHMVSSGSKDSHTDMSNKSTNVYSASRKNVTNDKASSKKLNKSNRCKLVAEEIKEGNNKLHVIASGLQTTLETW